MFGLPVFTSRVQRWLFIGLNLAIIPGLLLCGYFSSHSASFLLAKKAIARSLLVRQRTGGIIQVADFPSAIDRGDSIEYFTKVRGRIQDFYVRCTLHADATGAWQVDSITENTGQFYQHKKRH